LGKFLICFLAIDLVIDCFSDCHIIIILHFGTIICINDYHLFSKCVNIAKWQKEQQE
jgi:hypothetical protein